MAGTTVDLKPLANTIRLRLLLTRSVSGSATLAERLSGGLHRTPPDNATYPYGAFRLMNLRPHPTLGTPFAVCDCELQLFFRPRAASDDLEDATDVAVEALEGWVDLANGVSECHNRDRDTLPPFSEHADHEVITSRTTFALVVFPLPAA